MTDDEFEQARRALAIDNIKDATQMISDGLEVLFGDPARSWSGEDLVPLSRPIEDLAIASSDVLRLYDAVSDQLEKAKKNGLQSQ